MTQPFAMVMIIVKSVIEKYQTTYSSNSHDWHLFRMLSDEVMNYWNSCESSWLKKIYTCMDCLFLPNKSTWDTNFAFHRLEFDIVLMYIQIFICFMLLDHNNMSYSWSTRLRHSTQIYSMSQRVKAVLPAH